MHRAMCAIFTLRVCAVGGGMSLVVRSRSGHLSCVTSLAGRMVPIVDLGRRMGRLDGSK